MRTTLPLPTEARHARRVDSVMRWVISIGGLLIIGAVLAILLFLGNEALPLFQRPKIHSVASLEIGHATSLLVDESGASMVVIQPEGMDVVSPVNGEVFQHLDGGPALPYSCTTPVNAKGEFGAVGSDGRLFMGRLTWVKEAGEQDPHRWRVACEWLGGFPVAETLTGPWLLHATESSGLGGEGQVRVAAITSQGAMWSVFNAAPPDPGKSPPSLVWKPLPLADGQDATALHWDSTGNRLYLGTRQGKLFGIELEGEEALPGIEADFGEPVTALGAPLGNASLLVGGAKGTLAAYQWARSDAGQVLQRFHDFQPLEGPVLGFMNSLRDKRFLAWSPKRAALDHLTSERRLWSTTAPNIDSAALSPKGDLALLIRGDGQIQGWSVDAAHPEISPKVLWGKVTYEGYAKPEYVWQSTGGTDDFESKFSLMPLVFGTFKGTLYAMLFALPLAIFAAIYTSQFASPRVRAWVKPSVEIMAALPSVVLGFFAGLVLAPVFEKHAVGLLLVPALLVGGILLLTLLWTLLPQAKQRAWGTGRETLWAIPVLIASLALAFALAPRVEGWLMGGDYQAWLLKIVSLKYDQRNALVVGFAMGFAVIPIIYTISEDALSSVPKHLTSASLACGASPWQTAWRVVLPTASPGIFSASMVGLGRAIGETMIVLMATGNTPVMEWSPFNGFRTLAANIAVEIPEAPVHSTLYRVLFLAAILLFAFTFILNTVAEVVRQRLRKRYESI